MVQAVTESGQGAVSAATDMTENLTRAVSGQMRRLMKMAAYLFVYQGRRTIP